MNKDMKKINLSFEVNEDSFNLLKTIDEMGSAQYRDHEWDTLEEFKKSDVFLNGTHTEEWFLTRNFFGTFYLIDDLFEYGLVEIDGESWHLTYFVTNLGKTVLNNTPDVSDSDFIFSLLEKMLNKQEEDVVNYINKSMTQTERNRHSDNIWGYLLRAQGALAEIRLEMIANGRKIIDGECRDSE